MHFRTFATIRNPSGHEKHTVELTLAGSDIVAAIFNLNSNVDCVIHMSNNTQLQTLYRQYHHYYILIIVISYYIRI